MLRAVKRTGPPTRAAFSLIELLFVLGVLLTLISIAGLLGGGRSEHQQRTLRTADLVAQTQLVLRDNPHLSEFIAEVSGLDPQQVLVAPDHVFAPPEDVSDAARRPHGATWEWLQAATKPWWQASAGASSNRRPMIIRQLSGNSLANGLKLGGLQTRPGDWRKIAGISEPVLCDAWGQALVVILGGQEVPIVASWGPDGVPGAAGSDAFWTIGQQRGADLGGGDDIVRPQQ
jgi:type II secretory pathway pseudopilin PulG